jgi:hypothetical protein
MNLQPRTEQITVQKNFLWSTAGLVHKIGNVTLKGSAFADGDVVKAGTVVVVGADKKATAYDGATYTAADGRIYVTTNDVVANGADQQVGALEEAYLNGSKITGNHADLAVDSEYRFKVRS